MLHAAFTTNSGQTFAMNDLGQNGDHPKYFAQTIGAKFSRGN